MSESRERPAGENIPRPDPSRLTTELYDRGQETYRRELLAVRELLESQIHRIAQIHEEKFRGVETRLIESRAAIASALDAARALADVQNKCNAEASEKSERSFTKQIEALATQVATVTASQSREINDLKERFVTDESTAKGAVDNTTKLIAVAIFLLSLATFVYSIISHNTAPAPVTATLALPLAPDHAPAAR